MKRLKERKVKVDREIECDDVLIESDDEEH